MISPLKFAKCEWRRRHYSRFMVNLGFAVLDKERRVFVSFGRLTPNVVMIGAQKSGTTSMAHWLSGHPEIHVSCPMKEPGYFLFPEWTQAYFKGRGQEIRSLRQLLRDHMLLGFRGQKWFLDASTYYTTAKRVRDYEIAARMKESVQRILYLVRNPFDRMISNYRHVEDRVSCDFNELLMRDRSLVETSCYWYQLEPFIEQFGKSSVKVVIFEEMVADPQHSINEITSFLGVDSFVPKSGFTKQNVSTKSSTLRFSKENFRRISPRIRDDVAKLEGVLGRTSGWNLEEELWVD